MSKTEFYNRVLAEVMAHVYDACEQQGISFVASFQLDEEGDDIMFAHSCYLTKDAHEQLVTMAELQDGDALLVRSIPIMGEINSASGDINWYRQPRSD